MESNLLTIDEINLILKESNDPKYQIENLVHIGGTHVTIQRISKKTGLILIKGNDFTGFDHIMYRHHPASKVGHWKIGKPTKLDNPSMFNLGTVPIYDFLNIADDVYKPENKILEKNKKPEMFDLYIGKSKNKKNKDIEFKLLLYKDTRIIHNLYPQKKSFNKKTVLNQLRQGFSSGSWNTMSSIHKYSIPYYDNLNIERAKVIITLNINNGNEDWFIQINNSLGLSLNTQLVHSKVVKSYVDIPFRLTSLDYHEDLSVIEKKIKNMIAELGKV